MRTVLAALDNTAAARPVLDAALGLAELIGASVEAIHVRDGATDTPEALAERHAVPLRLLDGPVGPTLLSAIDASEITAAVLGARSLPGDHRPMGTTALDVAQRTLKPVLIVTPEASEHVSVPFRRLLLPLEGLQQSSRPVVETLLPLLAEDVELVMLHVFTPTTTPKFLDRPGPDLELLGDELRCRHCPAATKIELRTGTVGRRVEEVSGEDEIDLIVLAWSQTMEEGHAAVVRDVLVRSEVPVLLLPVTAEPLGPVPSRSEDPGGVRRTFDTGPDPDAGV